MNDDHLNLITRRQNIVVVVSDAVSGIRPGPQIGQEVVERSHVRLVYVAPLTLARDTLKHWWRTYFSENPMMVEITRFRRKFFGSGGSAVNGVIVAMSLVIYIGILALVWTYREDANPILLIFLQTFLFTLMGPAMLHAAIAGERERRSWDAQL